MTEIGEVPEGREMVRLGNFAEIKQIQEQNKSFQRTQRAQSSAILYYEVLPQRNRTRMTLIRRIFTDSIDPCASVSSVQSVFYRNPAVIDENNKPQINTDERRCILMAGCIKITNRKGRKERKAAQQKSLCPLCSLWLSPYSAPAHERAPPALHARLSRGGMSMEGGRMTGIMEIATVEVKFEEYQKEIMAK